MMVEKLWTRLNHRQKESQIEKRAREKVTYRDSTHLIKIMALGKGIHFKTVSELKKHHWIHPEQAFN